MTPMRSKLSYWGAHIFVFTLPNAMISTTMGAPKDVTQVFFRPYYEKNDDQITLIL
jgi:hypothetical protein